LILFFFKKFQKFFEEHPEQGSADRDVKISIDRIKANLKWMNSGYSPLSAWLATSQNVIAGPKLNFRLPTNLQPFNYDILVRFQFVNISGNGFPYDGEVTIGFTCVQDTSNLVLHVNKMLIYNSTLSLKSSTDQSFGELNGFNWYNDFERHFFIANLTKTLRNGHNYTLYMKYTGYLTDDNAGFYRSSYLDSNRTRKWLMTSQLESTDARKSFPCFDEPAMKANFKISVIHQRDYNALSNMPVERIIDV
jgi:aminopeptidase N